MSFKANEYCKVQLRFTFKQLNAYHSAMQGKRCNKEKSLLIRVIREFKFQNDF